MTLDTLCNTEHHALLCVGVVSPEDVEAIFPTQNPDNHVIVADRVGIENVRLLKRYAYQKPVKAPHRKFALVARGMTHEAQNALLKLMEDPPKTARFVLFLENEDVLLPTLRSRLYVVALNVSGTENNSTDFLRLPYTKRLQIIGEKLKANDTVWVSESLRSLEQYVSEHITEKSAADVLLVGQYADTRGASKKMLLEHLALSLPMVR